MWTRTCLIASKAGPNVNKLAQAALGPFSLRRGFIKQLYRLRQALLCRRGAVPW